MGSTTLHKKKNFIILEHVPFHLNIDLDIHFQKNKQIGFYCVNPTAQCTIISTWIGGKCTNIILSLLLHLLGFWRPRPSSANDQDPTTNDAGLYDKEE